jgi:hypothetical protein
MEYCILWNTVFHEETYWNTSRSIVFYEIPERDEILEYILYSNSIPPTASQCDSIARLCLLADLSYRYKNDSGNAANYVSNFLRNGVLDENLGVRLSG